MQSEINIKYRTGTTLNNNYITYLDNKELKTRPLIVKLRLPEMDTLQNYNISNSKNELNGIITCICQSPYRPDREIRGAGTCLPAAGRFSARIARS